MRTKLLALATCAFTLASCGDDCDHTDLWEKINEQETRIEALENWQQVVNNNLASLQQLVNQNDYITKVTPVVLDGQTVGYTIEFKNSPSITLYNGAKGDPGDTPQICLVQQEDGNWYWTLNGELMTDAESNPIRANGQDGKPGAAAPTPQLLTGSQLPEGAVVTNGGTITPDAVYLSMNNGKTWTKVSGNKGETGDKGENGNKGENGATGEQGEKGDAFFKEVKTDSEGYYVTFVLTDGTEIVLPTAQWANAWEEKVNALNTNVQTLQALVSGKQYITAVEEIAGTPGGYTIHLVDDRGTAQTVTIVNGKDGEKGETGDKGDSGLTPTVEIKGDTWWINGTDTHINATGTQGATGESGKTPDFRLTDDGNLQYRFDAGDEWITLGNVKGDKGDKGDTGDTGATGGQGATGPQGPQGDAVFAKDGVTVNSEKGYVEFTLAESKGSFKIPLYQDLKLTFTDPGILTNGIESYNSKITIGYSIGGNDAANASVSAVTDNGDWKVAAVSNSQVELEATGIGSANLMLFLAGKEGRTIVYTVKSIQYKAYTASNEVLTIEGDGTYIIKGNGTTQTTGHIIIKGNAKVTLQGVNIKPSTEESAITIESGSSTLLLEGENRVEGYGDGKAGIYVKENTTLTIEGNGKLDAIGALKAAGIGGINERSCGQIIIRSGTIYAEGEKAAGIGCGNHANCQGITITGGNITSHAKGGWTVGTLGASSENGSLNDVKNRCEFVHMSNCTIDVNMNGILAKEVTPNVSNAEALKAANVVYTKTNN